MSSRAKSLLSGYVDFFDRFPSARIDRAMSNVATVNEGFFACPQQVHVTIA